MGFLRAIMHNQGVFRSNGPWSDKDSEINIDFNSKARNDRQLSQIRSDCTSRIPTFGINPRHSSEDLFINITPLASHQT